MKIKTKKMFLFFKQVSTSGFLCLFVGILVLVVPVSSAVVDDPTVIGALIDVDPNEFNLNSKGRFLTAYIELTDPYTSAVGQIDIGSVKLSVNGYDIPAENKPSGIGDDNELSEVRRNDGSSGEDGAEE